MKRIYLGHGKSTLLDKEDFIRFSKFKWRLEKKRNSEYAIHHTLFAGTNFKIRLHRAILGLIYGDGKIVDHINGNGLDNRRCNLRLCNNSQNAANSKLYSNNSSGLKGVHWHKLKQKWSATIRFKGKKLHLGYFKSKIKARKKYLKKAAELHGEFSN